MRTALKILGGILLLLLVATGLWWWQYGAAFIYGQINSESEGLVGDAPVPTRLDAAAAIRGHLSPLAPPPRPDC